MKHKIFFFIFAATCLLCCKKENKKERIGEIIEAQTYDYGDNDIGYSVRVLCNHYAYLENLTSQDDCLDFIGICYSKMSSPTLNDEIIKFNKSHFNLVLDHNDYVSGMYSGYFGYLQNSTTYYWRAVIRKGNAVAYSEVQSFTTGGGGGDFYKPVVTTWNPDNVTANSAVLNGYINDVGAPPYSMMGMTIEKYDGGWYYYDDVVSIYKSGSDFSYNLTGLSPNTDYRYYAWAENSQGRGTGDWKYFKTSAVQGYAQVRFWGLNGPCSFYINRDGSYILGYSCWPSMESCDQLSPYYEISSGYCEEIEVVIGGYHYYFDFDFKSGRKFTVVMTEPLEDSYVTDDGPM